MNAQIWPVELGRSWLLQGTKRNRYLFRPRPGTLNRWARLPLEHWNLILDVAQGIDPQQAAALDYATHLTAINEATGEAGLDPAQLRTLVAFIRRLQTVIAHSPPLVPVATAAVPDEYENEEHIRMLEAVAAVFAESLRLGQPYDAWLD